MNQRKIVFRNWFLRFFYFKSVSVFELLLKKYKTPKKLGHLQPGHWKPCYPKKENRTSHITAPLI